MRAEFAEHGGHVCFHRGFGDIQFVGDLLVQQAGADHAEHAELLRGEFGDARRQLAFVVGQ